VRGCLFTLALGAAVIAGLVVFGLPRATEGLIAAGLTAGGLQAEQTQVTLDTASPLDLLRMHADRVTIRATNPRIGDLRADRLELELLDVHLGDRTAESLSGTFDDATFDGPEGSIAIPTIGFEGDTSRITAVASVDGPAVERLIAARVADATGQPTGDVELTAPNALTIGLGGIPVPGTLSVDDAGALRMRLEGPLALEVELLSPQATPLALRAVRVAGDRLVLEGDLDPATLFG
jgi:hypothetical protein